MMCTVERKQGLADFPCGQCMACRINKARKWKARLILEWYTESHKGAGAFVTLTYAPEHLPADGVRKRDLQLFMKRYRKLVDQAHVRFDGVGEDGEVSGRAHYHVILFGVDPQWVSANIRRVWKLGLTHVGFISEASLAYVADYSLKALRRHESCSDGRNPPFRLMSRRPGIGGNAAAGVKASLLPSPVLDVVDEFGCPKEIRVGGELVPLDRYMRLKVESLLPLSQSGVERHRRALASALEVPPLSLEEKREKRRAAAAKAMSKKARRARKAKI